MATFNTSTPHGLVVGELITLYGFTDLTFNFNQLPPPYFNYPYPFGFRVDSVASPTQFTAVVPGADSAFVAEDGWINLVGGGYNSSIILGYAGIVPDPFTGIPFQYLIRDNIAFTGKGAGKTRVRFADHASTKRNDNFGFNIQMLKCLGNYAGNGVVGAPGAYPGKPVDATNCKNLKIEGITFDGNYTNNGPRDIKIVSVSRTSGINTYNTEYPALIESTTPTVYSPAVLPAPTNQSAIPQYIDGVKTGPNNDQTFNGFGSIINITTLSFQRDLRCPFISARRTSFTPPPTAYNIYTKHPQFNFGYTIGDSITVTGFSDASYNGTFTVAGFLSAQEVYCLRSLPTVAITSYERLTNVGIYDTGANHNFVGGETVVITGLADASMNGTFVVSSITAPNQFTVSNIGPDTGVVVDVGVCTYLYSPTQIVGYERLTNVGYYDTVGPHGFTGGEAVVISGLTDASMNGTFVVTGAPSLTQFTVANIGPDTGVIADAGTYSLSSNTAKSWAAPDIGLTPQVDAGVNSSFTVAGLNLVGENTLVQDCEFYDYGVGIADAETFVLKSFLPSTVDTLTKGSTIRRNRFGYQGRNSVQATLYPGSSEANTQCTIGGYSSLQAGINVVKRQANVATYTTASKHTLQAGDVIKILGFPPSPPAIPAVAAFNGTFTVLARIDDYNFTVSQVAADVMPGLYLDGSVIMVRSLRIFAKECVFENNRIEGGPNPINQQCPVHGFTPRETNGCEVRYNNFDGFTGTCMYVDSYHHYGTHVHHNSGQNVSAFIALNVQDWYAMIAAIPGSSNPETYSTLISAHKDMLIEYNDVLLTGPASWYYQPAFAPLDAVFVINNHDVNRSAWYYPTDYQIPITTATRAANVITFTTASDHELQPGFEVSTAGTANGTFSGVFTVATVPNSTQFTVANIGPGATSAGGFVGINNPIHFPWEIKMSARARTGGTATYTTTKAHNMSLGYHVTIEGFTDPTFNGEFIVTGMPTTTTFQVANAGPDVATVTEPGNFFRYVENIQIRCNTVRRLSGNELFVNNGGKFGPSFLAGRPERCVAPLEQTTYLDCPEGCLDLQCDPGPCKPDDYIYRI